MISQKTNELEKVKNALSDENNDSQSSYEKLFNQLANMSKENQGLNDSINN